ncbi:MAG: hypothetical protein U0599_05020 [Vicinamibacteria bacterium]
MSAAAARLVLVVLVAAWPAASAAGAPAAAEAPGGARRPDWMLDAAPYRAEVAASPDGREVVLQNGLLRRAIRLLPNAATVALDDLTTGASEIRSVRPEARVEIDGRSYDVGGLVGQEIHNYLRPEWVDALRADPAAFRFVGFETGRTRERFAWKPNAAWLSREAAWPPPGAALTLGFRAPDAAPAGARHVIVRVHYELYDGLPVLSKWLTVENRGKTPVRLNRFTGEIFATVEPGSFVGVRDPAEFVVDPRSLHVETDYSFGDGMTAHVAAAGVHWKPDPLYTTQVNYAKATPCLLETHPPIGPDQEIAPGATFESFRTFVLLHDSTERERRGLALRRFYRALAPWSQENPVLMHVRSAEPAAVRLAVDQAADVGFEMVILTFGSGVDLEKDDPATLAGLRALVDYARGRGVVLGAYSLLASRRISDEDDVVNPQTGKPGGFAVFGSSPCLGSRWGEGYFRKLRGFFEATGASVLEHDGSYPGDACASTAHPGHRGYDDSQWSQWTTIRDFYRWCRARGIYLNVPDWYFLSGSSKTGMGYRETNWSLPREQQEIVERQNVYDGTWEKTPSMGWMFVPLTEYHGGGAAATIEPLSEHLDHYEARLASLFGAGVQACYRGPRLYDTEATRAVVKRWVSFYRANRRILDADVVHLRRPDGRDWDGLMHVDPDPRSRTRALAALHNPLATPIEREVRLPLYYSGLTDAGVVRVDGGPPRRVRLDRAFAATVRVNLPARGRGFVTVEAP